jgi:hypothetical protein
LGLRDLDQLAGRAVNFANKELGNKAVANGADYAALYSEILAHMGNRLYQFSNASSVDENMKKFMQKTADSFTNLSSQLRKDPYWKG